MDIIADVAEQAFHQFQNDSLCMAVYRSDVLCRAKLPRICKAGLYPPTALAARFYCGGGSARVLVLEDVEDGAGDSNSFSSANGLSD